MKRFSLIIIPSLIVLLIISCRSNRENALITITDQNWILKELNGNPVTVTGTRQPYIIFQQKENRINGNAGCNNFFGSYQIKGDQVTFSNVGATKMACQDMQIENSFFQFLQTPLTFSISGNELIFKDSNGSIAAKFEKGSN